MNIPFILLFKLMHDRICWIFKWHIFLCCVNSSSWNFLHIDFSKTFFTWNSVRWWFIQNLFLFILSYFQNSNFTNWKISREFSSLLLILGIGIFYWNTIKIFEKFPSISRNNTLSFHQRKCVNNWRSLLCLYRTWTTDKNNFNVNHESSAIQHCISIQQRRIIFSLF